MVYSRLDIRGEGSLPDAYAQTYILDTPEGILIKKRPLVIVCPGGGYEHLSTREGEPIAIEFNRLGYHAIVLHYSIAPAVYPTALIELARTVSLVHKHADEWKVDAEKIFVSGFSAGGHLAASYGVNYKKDFIKDAIGNTDDEKLKIKGMVLGYPVITAGEYAHKGSFERLLGIPKDTLNKDNSNVDDETKKKLDELSLEKQVNDDVPPTFLWTTFEDVTVPAENSILFMNELRKRGIVTEFHMFPAGRHGLALGTELTNTSDGNTHEESVVGWIELAGRFIRNL